MTPRPQIDEVPREFTGEERERHGRQLHVRLVNSGHLRREASTSTRRVSCLAQPYDQHDDHEVRTRATVQALVVSPTSPTIGAGDSLAQDDTRLRLRWRGCTQESENPHGAEPP